MSHRPRKRKFHYKNVIPKDPQIKPIRSWLPENRGFYDRFRRWLQANSYSPSTIQIYGAATRHALGYLDKPYWKIDPEADLQRVWERLQTHDTTPSTQDCYRRGLAKLGDYLRLVTNRPSRQKPINWNHYLGTFPDWLAADVRDFIRFRRQTWLPETRFEKTVSTLSHTTLALRWMVDRTPLQTSSDLTPDLWFAYVDARLSQGITPRSVNGELRHLLGFLHFLQDQGRPVCPRMFRVDYLAVGPEVPKDLPASQIQRLLAAIQAEIARENAANHRMGLMDWTWCLLMLHSGLRTGEVRRLKLSEIDWERRLVRIEQSKGLKDRLVPISPTVMEALERYLEVRGPAEALPDQVFIFRHAPLSRTYCYQRLRTYGRRCQVQVTPHQLRHSCATLLLNAGAPVLMVKAILGHRFIDTTLKYARLYDGTVAADYYRAMAQVEQQIELVEQTVTASVEQGELLALVDALQAGTLNPTQNEIVQALRASILALAG